MANIPGTSIPQPGVPIGAPSGATPIGMSGASSVVPTASPISSSVTDTIKGLTAPVNTPEYSAQLSKVVQDLVKQLGNAPSATSPDKKIPDTNISTPTPGITPSPTGVKDLLSNTAIDQLGKKIQTQLDNLGAGIPTTGSSQMLSDLMTKFGVSGAQDALNTYNQTILKEKQQIANLPEAIKNTLAGVGINQDQLTRLVAKESLPHEKALNEAMAQAGAQEKQITNALDFVKLFSNAAEKDRAAQLEIAKFQITNNLGLYKNLQTNQKKIMQLAIDDKKAQMAYIKEAGEKGAPLELLTNAQNAGSYAEAQRILASFYQEKVGGNLNKRIAVNLGVSESEIAKGLTASGKTIDAFSQLSPKDQLDYIYGAKKDLAGGRLIPKDLEKLKTNIKDAIVAGKTRQELETKISDLKLPPADELELLLMLDQSAPPKVSFMAGLKSIFGL